MQFRSNRKLFASGSLYLLLYEPGERFYLCISSSPERPLRRQGHLRPQHPPSRAFNYLWWRAAICGGIGVEDQRRSRRRKILRRAYLHTDESILDNVRLQTETKLSLGNNTPYKIYIGPTRYHRNLSEIVFWSHNAKAISIAQILKRFIFGVINQRDENSYESIPRPIYSLTTNALLRHLLYCSICNSMQKERRDAAFFFRKRIFSLGEVTQIWT